MATKNNKEPLRKLAESKNANISLSKSKRIKDLILESNLRESAIIKFEERIKSLKKKNNKKIIMN